MAKKIDRKRIRSAVQNERVIAVRTTNYLARERASIDEVLEVFLEEAELLEYRNKVAYCVHELAANAQKGNTKRAYFYERGLNIHDAYDYRRGMETFRRDTFDRVEHYIRVQRKLGLYLQLTFQLDGPEARIGVTQNCALTTAERERIQEKLDLARRSESLVSAYDHAYDSYEGAGLGLVMTILMLRRIGLHDDVLEPDFRSDETRFSLRLRRMSAESLQTA
jgi:hypothetical protein